MKSSIQYKGITIMASLVCIASLGAMESELPVTNLVSSQEIKELTQSIMMATEEEVDSSKESRGWFTGFKDWIFGLDTNVVSELQKGTLTKDMLAQDKELQSRACKAVTSALQNKRTENLCTLLNQLHKFEMLACVTEQNDAITQFLNAQIPLICEQKASVKLMDVLTTMKTMQFVVDSTLVVAINEVLNEQKERDVQPFKNVYQEAQGLVAQILERLEKDKERFKNPLIEAKDILLMQHYLAGNGVEMGPKQMKEELGLIENEKALTALLKALNGFVDKK